jgi:hypothetical protein
VRKPPPARVLRASMRPAMAEAFGRASQEGKSSPLMMALRRGSPRIGSRNGSA